VRKTMWSVHVNQALGLCLRSTRAGGARTNLSWISQGDALGEVEVHVRAHGESHERCEEEEEEENEDENEDEEEGGEKEAASSSTIHEG
jgi:hypothetical protein